MEAKLTQLRSKVQMLRHQAEETGDQARSDYAVMCQILNSKFQQAEGDFQAIESGADLGNQIKAFRIRDLR